MSARTKVITTIQFGVRVRGCGLWFSTMARIRSRFPARENALRLSTQGFFKHLRSKVWVLKRLPAATATSDQSCLTPARHSLAWAAEWGVAACVAVQLKNSGDEGRTMIACSRVNVGKRIRFHLALQAGWARFIFVTAKLRTMDTFF